MLAYERPKNVDFFFPKSVGALLSCAEHQSSPSSGSSAGMGLILLCLHQFAAICLPPK